MKRSAGAWPKAAACARSPGRWRVEMDYAGDTLEWIDLATGEIRKAYVFVAALGFSQLLFAWAAKDMKSRNWLGAHRRMFAYYGGAPHVTVPDCLKQGVLKCQLYDPDLNPGYAQLASHFATAVVPARPSHPKDKALAEGAVKILMRYVRFRHRRTRFTSLSQINQAIAECIEHINARRHTRFGVSRRERFESVERAALKPLPAQDFDAGEWKEATLHADCYNEPMPGTPGSRQPRVDDAAVYFGHLDGQTAEGGFNTLLNWRKNATCTSTLCSTASDPAACRAASSDPYREIDTRCVGVASGFLGYNFQSYPVANLGSWPTGWEPTTTNENEVPRIDTVGADASGSAWFDKTDETAGANCYSYSGGILGTTTLPCRAKIYLGLLQNLALTGLTPTAPPPLRLVFSTRGDSLTASVVVRANVAIYYRNPAGVVCPAGTSPLPATSPTQCVQTVTNNVTVANSTQWQSNQFTITPIAHPASPQIDRVALFFSANAYVGRIGLDAISVVPTGGTELVRNGSFDGGHLQASTGDYAANFLSRLGGVAFWGSLSHHQSSGNSFYRAPLRSPHFLARGLTLGEAVWLGDIQNSGILYGDPLYSPTRMRMLPLADDEGRFVTSQPLRAFARYGTDPSTREVRFSACRGNELFRGGSGNIHPAALRCTRGGGWSDLPISTRVLTGSTITTSVPLDPAAPISRSTATTRCACKSRGRIQQPD